MSRRRRKPRFHVETQISMSHPPLPNHTPTHHTNTMGECVIQRRWPTIDTRSGVVSFVGPPKKLRSGPGGLTCVNFQNLYYVHRALIESFVCPSLVFVLKLTKNNLDQYIIFHQVEDIISQFTIFFSCRPRRPPRLYPSHPRLNSFPYSVSSPTST